MPGGIRLLARAEADIATPPADEVTVFVDADLGNAIATKDEDGVVSPIQAPPLTFDDHSSTGSTETVDASVADVQRLVANAATVTLTLTGWPAAGTPGIIQLYLEQDGTGGRDWVFPAEVTFGEAGEPDWTDQGPGEISLVNLETIDGGTTVVATVAGARGPAGADGADGTLDDLSATLGSDKTINNGSWGPTILSIASVPDGRYIAIVSALCQAAGAGSIVFRVKNGSTALDGGAGWTSHDANDRAPVAFTTLPFDVTGSPTIVFEAQANAANFVVRQTDTIVGMNVTTLTLIRIA